MELSRYNNEIITSFSKRLLEYLEDIHTISFQNDKQKQELHYNGFKTMIHTLCVLHLIKMDGQQIDSYLEKAYILHNEYTQQVYSKNLEFLHSPSLFVHNVLLGNIGFNDYKEKEKMNKLKDSTSPFGVKISTWCNMLMFWENTELTMENRIHITENFLKSYLLLFYLDKNYEAFRLFHHIQQLGLLNNISFEKYSFFLTSFLNYFTNNNLHLKQRDVEDICFDKFLNKKEECKTMFENAKQIKDMEEFMSWIFVKE